jgi:LmbE family N-acetylglucosaminyl deacetylase
MERWLIVLEHAFVLVMFAVLAAGVILHRDRLRRTTRRARILAKVMLGIATVAGVVNLVQLLVFVGMGEDGHETSWLALRSVFIVIGFLAQTALIVVLLRYQILVSPRPTPRRILAIGAHPDDFEIAAGGTLARLRDEGHSVRGLVLTHGEQGGNAERRVQEVQKGAAFLGMEKVTLLDFPDTRLREMDDAVRNAIENEIRSFQPDIVLTHSIHDQHQDHLIVHAATMRAGRRVKTILCYESPSVTPDFKPGLYVEIGNYVDVKIESIREHCDQQAKAYVDAEHVRAQARFRGGQAKTNYAEGFEIGRALMMEGGTL